MTLKHRSGHVACTESSGMRHRTARTFGKRAADSRRRLPSKPPEAPAQEIERPTDCLQVVNRHCTICDWEAQLIERGSGGDPLCPWCFGPTERTSIVGLVLPETLSPDKSQLATLGRLGGLKGGPARAARLSAKRRRDIAVKAARARWGTKPGKSRK
jgi:hypothetical protein